jgi:hypothetical protein
VTRYTVIWHRYAEAELAEAWINARDRNAVSTAARVIDLELAQDAATKGTEVIKGLRAFLAPPLRILYRINEGDRIVKVVRVRSF